MISDQSLAVKPNLAGLVAPARVRSSQRVGKVSRGNVPGLGSRIAAARAKASLTQAELAQALGMSTHDAVSRWEREDNVPETQTVILLSLVLDVTTDWLLKGDDDGSDDAEFERFLAEIVPTLATPPTQPELDRIRKVAHHRARADDFGRHLRQVRRGLTDAQIRAEERATRAAKERGDGLGVRRRGAAK